MIAFDREHVFVEISAVAQARQRIALTVEAQPVVRAAHARERPDERPADAGDERRGGKDGLLTQALAAHLGSLELIVPPQQLELARLALVVEFCRELEER